MKIQFLFVSSSDLASEDAALLEKVKAEMLARDCVEVFDSGQADAIVLNEAFSFKEWRYIRKLSGDPIVGRYPHKIYTINTDDSAAGLLRGIYTSLAVHRFDARFHRAVPYAACLNERVLQRIDEVQPERKYLAAWRGNTISHPIRKKLVRQLAGNPRFHVAATESWFNHDAGEKDAYVDLLLASKFSLCPAGWAPVTFRIYESMALGIAPVILADGFVPPNGPDWSSFALTWKESRLAELETLLAQNEKDYVKRGHLAKIAWERYFSPQNVHGYYADSLLECIRANPGSSRAAELKRWNSDGMAWANRWTIPQRLANKFAKWRGKMAN
jgi:hypothetical protein